MSANRLYLVCSHHTNPEDALLLGERESPVAAYDPAKFKNAEAWFQRHADCGRSRDHFQLAYGRPQNWDVSPPAEESVAGGVKVAMAMNGVH